MKYLHYCESISDFKDKSEHSSVSDPWVSVTEGFEGVTYSPSLDTGGYECVDLGLPSEYLWASCNIGASNPEDYGYYFSWGEVNPKNTYDWTTYAWGTSATSFSRYGQANQAVSLYTSDDAAIVNMRSFWRMPTIADYQELVDNTTSTWETLNGVYGTRFTAENGNSIFFPAAGAKHQEGYYYEPGSTGLFWIPTRIANQKALASAFVIDPDRVTVSGASSRPWGLPIRGVFVDRRYWYNKPIIHK